MMAAAVDVVHHWHSENVVLEAERVRLVPRQWQR